MKKPIPIPPNTAAIKMLAGNVIATSIDGIKKKAATEVTLARVITAAHMINKVRQRYFEIFSSFTVLGFFCFFSNNCFRLTKMLFFLPISVLCKARKTQNRPNQTSRRISNMKHRTDPINAENSKPS